MVKVVILVGIIKSLGKNVKGKFGEWDFIGRLWKVLICFWILGRLCICLGRIWDGFNFLIGVVYEVWYKEDVKIKVEL